MQLNLVTWDGHDIQGSSYSAYFPEGQPVMPGSNLQWVKRAQNFPKLAGKDLLGGMVTIAIQCVSAATDYSTLFEQLKQWFQVNDYTLRALVATDADNADKQWYLMGYPYSPVMLDPDLGPGNYLVQLALKEPYWRSVVVENDSWALTSYPSSKVLTANGNSPSHPIFQLTVGTPKGGAYVNRWWRPIENQFSNGAGDYPYDVTDGGWNTAALIADNSNKCQVNQGGGIGSSDTTIPYDTVTGALPSAGQGMIGTEQIAWTGKTGTTSGNLTGVTRGLHGTTAASHADNSVIYLSHLNADGSDIRVHYKGAEIDCWIGNLNTSTTKVWVNLRFSPMIQVTLKGGLLSTGGVASIAIHPTRANTKLMKDMPSKYTVIIDNEVFVGSQVNETQLTLEVDGRAQKGSTAAAHSDGAIIRWLEIDSLYIVYGCPTEVPQVTNDDLEPIIDLNASTNTSWVYTQFTSDKHLRSGRFYGSVLQSGGAARGGETAIYTGPHATDADPATEMGAAIRAYYFSGKWMPETATLQWSIFLPFGVTAITVTGAKYRSLNQGVTTEWDMSIQGSHWQHIWTESPSSLAATWQALDAHSAVSLAGIYYYLRQLTYGSLNGSANNEADIETTGVTLALPSTQVPHVVLTVTAEDTCYLNTTIRNDTTGEEIYLIGALSPAKVLTIDCDAQEIHLSDGNLFYIDWSSIRDEWLDFVTGNNTIIVTDTGTAPISITTNWEDRETL